MRDTGLSHFYILSLGSNRAISRNLPPAQLLREAAHRIARLGEIMASAPIILTAPLGPSLRRFANSALILRTPLPPKALLARLQQIERELGRKRHRRWGARSMDIDIILWSGGRWNSRTLHIPHREFRGRAFVLSPSLDIAPEWRDPASGLTIRHLHSRLRKARPVARPRG
jgi:2-amino-4-hydroxy-6-hydroxymethyldihydropteridine diphosphokinase